MIWSTVRIYAQTQFWLLTKSALNVCVISSEELKAKFYHSHFLSNSYKYLVCQMCQLVSDVSARNLIHQQVKKSFKISKLAYFYFHKIFFALVLISFNYTAL